MGSLGGAELLIIAVVVVVIFGAGWLPKAARNLGKAKVEFDAVQKQLTDTKDSFVEATGVKELESSINKANKVLNTSPKKLVTDAVKGKPAAPADAGAEDDIEDAEIVEPSTDTAPQGADAGSTDPDDDTNVNVDFS